MSVNCLSWGRPGHIDMQYLLNVDLDMFLIHTAVSVRLFNSPTILRRCCHLSLSWSVGLPIHRAQLVGQSVYLSVQPFTRLIWSIQYAVPAVCLSACPVQPCVCPSVRP